MQEAFRKAVDNNPGSALNKQLRDVERTIADERREQARKRRREKELKDLTELMRTVGADWKLSESLGSKEEKEYLARIRRVWEEKSVARELQSASQDERVAMLQGFATGAAINRLPLPMEYRMTMLEELGRGSNALKQIQGMFGLAATLSPQAHIMVRAYADVARLDDKQRSSLTDFMFETKDTRTVTLQQSLVRISEWISAKPTAKNIK